MRATKIWGKAVNLGNTSNYCQCSLRYKIQKTILTIIIAILLVGETAEVKATEYFIEDGDDILELDLINNDMLSMTGGTLVYLDAYATSTSIISNGFIDYLDAYDSSTINVSGGEILYLSGFISSTISLSGGTIAHGMGIDNSSTVHIYGYDFYYDPVGGSFGDGLLIGSWADSTLFSIDLKDWESSTYDHIVFHEIPEPSSLILLSLVGLFIRRKN